MRAIFTSLLALIATGAVHACSCTRSEGASVCSSFAGTQVVFLGRVIRDSGEGVGTGPARLVVEELFHGLPKETREVEVDTSAGTSCYRRLVKDERYVVFASQLPGRLSSGGCSFTFNVRGNELLLDGLRQAYTGGAPRLVGKTYIRSGQYASEPSGPAGFDDRSRRWWEEAGSEDGIGRAIRIRGDRGGRVQAHSSFAGLLHRSVGLSGAEADSRAGARLCRWVIGCVAERQDLGDD